MRNLFRNNGSIIMEFLLVMPIYFVMIGGIFWIGELLLNRSNLLVADRLAVGHWGTRHDWDNDKRKRDDNTMLMRLNIYLFDTLNRLSETAFVTDVVQSRAMCHNDFSWTQTVGGKTSLFATQPSWTLHWLKQGEDKWRAELQSSQLLPVSMKNASGNISDMNANISEYNFLNVSLMRTKLGETAYRSWKPGRLCHECFQKSCNGYTCIAGIPVGDAVWFRGVYREEFPPFSLDELKQKMLPQNEDSERANCGKNKHEDYARFPTYFLWSQ